MLKRYFVVAVALVAAAAPTAAAEFDGEAIARSRINPFSDRIIVPLKNDWDWGGGPEGEGFGYRLEVEPLIPLRLSGDWLLISRTIVPFRVESEPGEGGHARTGSTGFGDVTQSLFLSPRKKLGGWLAAGAGPAFLVPTSTSEALGNERFSAGPTMAFNIESGPWVFNFVGFQLWSLGGDNHQREVNRAFLQPSVTYIGPRGTNYTINTETECDWLLEGTQCAVPVALTIGHPVRLNSQVDLHFSAGGRYFAVQTEASPRWGVRFEVAFIFEQE